MGTAFLPRETDDFLSVNWLEITGEADRQGQLEKVRAHLAANGLTLRASGRFAILHLGSAFAHVRTTAEDARQLAAHYEPDLPNDPSHSGIYGYDHSDQLIADLLAECVIECHPARR